MQSMDKIEAVRIHAGFWQLHVNGTPRPIYAGRQGRNWIVQGPSRLTARTNDVHHGSFRTLADAKSMMNVVWWALSSERELAYYEAQVTELGRLKTLARRLGITYPISKDIGNLPIRIAAVKALIEDAGYETARGTRVRWGANH